MVPIKIVFFNLTILYFISVICWTTYGYIKAIDEYMCFEKRPGGLTSYSEHDQVVDLRFINKGLNDTIFFQYGSLDLKYQDAYDMGSGYKRPFVDIGDSLGKTFNFNNSNNLKLKIEKMQESDNFWSSNYTKYYYNFELYNEPNYIYISCISSDESKSMGSFGKSIYFREGGYPHLGHEVFDKKWPPSFLRCSISIKLETCSIRPRGVNTFLLLAPITTAIYLILYVLSSYFLTIKIHLYNLLSLLRLEDPCAFPFCNPLDNKLKRKVSGDKVAILSENETDIGVTLVESMRYSGENYILEVTGDRFVAITRNTGEIRVSNPISAKKMKQIKLFICYINIDNSNWFVDDTRKHYLTMKEVFDYFIEGDLNFVTVEIVDTIYVTKNLDLFKDCISSRMNMSKEVVQVFAEHNSRFFKGLNITALFNVIKGETNWQNKPTNIINTAWKRYTNDTNLLLSYFNYKVNFNQYKNVKKPTEVLKNLLEDLEIVNDDEVDSKNEGFGECKIKINNSKLGELLDMIAVKNPLTKDLKKTESSMDLESLATEFHNNELVKPYNNFLNNYLKFEEVDNNIKLLMEDNKHTDVLEILKSRELLLKEEYKTLINETYIERLYTSTKAKIKELEKSLAEVMVQYEKYKKLEKRAPFANYPDRHKAKMDLIDIKSIEADKDDLEKKIKYLIRTSPGKRDVSVAKTNRKKDLVKIEHELIKCAESQEAITSSMNKEKVFEETFNTYKNALLKIVNERSAKTTKESKNDCTKASINDFMVALMFKPMPINLHVNNNKKKQVVLPKEKFKKLKTVQAKNQEVFKLNIKNRFDVLSKLKEINEDLIKGVKNGSNLYMQEKEKIEKGSKKIYDNNNKIYLNRKINGSCKLTLRKNIREKNQDIDMVSKEIAEYWDSVNNNDNSEKMIKLNKKGKSKLYYNFRSNLRHWSKLVENKKVNVSKSGVIDFNVDSFRGMKDKLGIMKYNNKKIVLRKKEKATDILKLPELLKESGAKFLEIRKKEMGQIEANVKRIKLELESIVPTNEIIELDLETSEEVEMSILFE